ncbi:MAG TPA: hypothetical protein VHX88_14420 [Solirubrobacteraceae bacterium]|nr:hypothetical protein [Solirubrobacteraceae bacterium]
MSVALPGSASGGKAQAISPDTLTLSVAGALDTQALSTEPEHVQPPPQRFDASGSSPRSALLTRLRGPNAHDPPLAVFPAPAALPPQASSPAASAPRPAASSAVVAPAMHEHPGRLPRASSSPLRIARGVAVGAALIGLALLIAGCGGGSSPGVANIAGSKSASGSAAADAATPGTSGAGAAALPGSPSGNSGRTVGLAAGAGANLLKFAACMRANGVPNFPDPSGSGGIQFSANAIDPDSASFQAAMQKCQKYMGAAKVPSPAQRARTQAQALAFSDCMRAHGVTNFPDPQFSAHGVSIKVGAGNGPASGLDPNSPIFQKAQKACAAKLPGKAGLAPVAVP